MLGKGSCGGGEGGVSHGAVGAMWGEGCGVEGRRGSGKFGERGGDEARRCGAKCGGPYGLRVFCVTNESLFYEDDQL